MFVTSTPLSLTLVVLHELMKLPRLLAFQQNVPAPSKVKGIVMEAVTGLQVPGPPVGAVVTVAVRVGVLVGAPAVGVLVRVGVLVGRPAVGVTVGVGKGG